MSELFIYLIKANIALCLFYLAYRLGLRRLTFYTLNRFFLLTGIVFSSLFPLVDVNDFLNRNEKLAQQVVTYVPDLTAWQQPVQADTFTVWTLLAWVFWAGVAVMFLRLVMQLVSLFFLHKNTDPANIQDRPVRVMGSSMNPFSFFRNIYINPALHSPEELQAILQHESIHVKEWHSADVLMGEINNIFYWFNPGAWLMKTAIKENLEFLTDRKMLRTGVDKKSYQYSLVQVNASQYAAGIANNFNFSHLKNRIKMMNKQKSSRVHIYRYAVLGCLTCGVLLSLNFTKAGTVVMNNVVKEVKNVLEVTPKDTIPAKPKVVEVVVTEDKKGTIPKTVTKRTDSASSVIIISNATGQFDKKHGDKITGDRIDIKGAQAPTMLTIQGVKGKVSGVSVQSFDVKEERKPGGVTEGVKGKVSGVSIQSTDVREERKPGAVTLRLAGNQISNPPLFVVDGVPVKEVIGGNALQQINPDDIESISVLKDKSAVALYGTKGINGVILVTTKQGQQVKVKEDGLKEVVVVGYGSKKPDTEGAQTLKSVVVLGYAVPAATIVEGGLIAGDPTPSSAASGVSGGGGKTITSTANVTYSVTKVPPAASGVTGGGAKPGTVTSLSTYSTSGAATTADNLKLSVVKTPPVEKATNIASLSVSPNPGSGIFSVAYTTKAGNGYLEVKDINGKPVYHKTLSGAAGSYKETIDLSRFPAGIYILTLSQDGMKVVSRLSKI